jgi:heme o synthase
MAKLIVSGEEKLFDAPADMALLWVVRDILGMTGSKLGSRITERHVCAVGADRSSVDSSKLSAGAIRDRSVTPIDGIGKTAHRFGPRSVALGEPRGACETRDSRNLSVEKFTIKTIAIPLSDRHLASQRRFAGRLPDLIALMKPRVMMLAVFTALVGMASAPHELDPLHAFIAVLAIAAGAGAAGVLNMWYDADIDAIMTRTAMRPIPRGKVSQLEALILGLALATGAVLLLALATNLVAAALLAGAILFYVLVYTVWLKRFTRQNIVIGGAAGALPPVIGWTAATGYVGVEPLALFLIIFLWTPPHFWALALNRVEEYARGGVPMLPVVSGKAATKRQILIYSVLLVPASALPWVLGFAGGVYGLIAVTCGAVFVGLAVQLDRSREADRRVAHCLFLFSITYLFVLFAALLVDHRGGPGSLMPTPVGARAATGLVRDEFLSAAVQPNRDSIDVGKGEV